MTIITHDIVPDGDLYIILKEPNTQKVLPDVSLRVYNWPDYLPDHDRLDAPSVTFSASLFQNQRYGLHQPKKHSKLIREHR
jgi:hypothetical protein